MKKIGMLISALLIHSLILAQTSILTTKVSLKIRNGTLQEALEILHKDYNIHFSYGERILKIDKKITLKLENQSLSKVLEEILRNTDIQYNIIGNQIVLSKIKKRTSLDKYTLTGQVLEKESNESLVGVNVYVPSLQIGTTTNQNGFYSLNLPEDSLEIVFSYLGNNAVIKNIYADKNLTLNIEIEPRIDLKEVQVTSPYQSQLDSVFKNTTSHNKFEVPLLQVRSMPALIGEKDILKSMQFLPGVNGGTEGTSGLYVRGGGPDQNIVLLDNTPIYQTSRLLGLISFLNESVVQSADFYKSSFPARYGGRLSSVLDIQTKDGNYKKLHGEVSVSPIMPKIMLEGPLIKDKTSFMIAARRPLYDLLIGIFSKGGKTRVGCYDVNAKVVHKFSETNRLALSFYKGDDFLYSKYDPDEFSLRSGSLAYSLTWNKTISNKLFLQSTLVFSQYRYKFQDINFIDSDYNIENQIRTTQMRDGLAKVNFNYAIASKHSLNFGINATHHDFLLNYVAYPVGYILPDSLKYIHRHTPSKELNVYLEDNLTLTSRLKTSIGVHAVGYWVNDKFYPSIQPRLAASYLANPNLIINASYNRMTQFIHLISPTANVISLADTWTPVTNILPPQKSQQFSLGIKKQLFKHKYELSVDVYYKTMQNILEYKNNATLNLADPAKVNDIGALGKGQAYGAEFLLHKKQGRTTGWVGYTLSWNYRSIPEIDNGKVFPYRYDQRHNIKMTLKHSFTPKIELAASWVYNTGTAFTSPISQYPSIIDVPENNDQYLYSSYTQQNIIQYSARNASRMPAYHRLDIGINFKKQKRYGERVWAIGVYNAYNRKNPIFISTQKENNTLKFQKEVLFPILPYFSYTLYF